MEEGCVAGRLVRREVIKTSVAKTPTSSSVYILNAELHFSHLLKNGAVRGWLGGSHYSTTFASFIRQQDESALLQEFDQQRSLKRTFTGEEDGDSVDDS